MLVRVAHRIRADGVRHTTDGIPLGSFAPIPESLNYSSSHKLSESSCAGTMMWIWLGNSLCLLPPPLFTPRGYCSIFTFLPIYHHHSSVAHPVVAEEVGHGVLEISCRDGSRHPTPTAPLITFLTMSFAYYHICCMTCINIRPNTWRHTIKVTSLAKRTLRNTPLPTLL